MFNARRYYGAEATGLEPVSLLIDSLLCWASAALPFVLRSDGRVKVLAHRISSEIGLLSDAPLAAAICMQTTALQCTYLHWDWSIC